MRLVSKYNRRTRYLASSSSASFGLVVFQKLDIVANQLLPDELLAHSFGELKRKLSSS